MRASDLEPSCRARGGARPAERDRSVSLVTTDDHQAIASLLRGLGVMLRSVTEPIDGSPSGKLPEAILAGTA